MSAWRTRSLARNCAKALFLLAVIAAVPAFAQDTQPPVLTSFTFSPMSINTATGPATITGTAQITDNLSGVNGGFAEYMSPSGSQGVGLSFSLTSGTNLNGTWTGTANFPQYGEAGTWIVSYLVVQDNVGNSQVYYTSDLTALGFPTQLQVTSDQDTQPPVLTGFTFSPMTINTTAGPATITGTAQITDNLSGVNGAFAEYSSPSGSQGVGLSFSLTSGTNLNGTWTGTANFPQYGEAGSWTVSYVVVQDNAGNSQVYYSSDLTALGFPTQLQVTSDQDTQPPVLTSFTFSPMSINTATGPATITGTAQITDNLSGVNGGFAEYMSPSGSQGVGLSFSLTSGTNLNGTWTGTANFPQYGEAGTWIVSYLVVQDNVGNSQVYYTSDLTALGFPTQLIVDSATTVTLASSNPRAPYGQPITFKATVTSSNGNIPTGTVNFDDGSTILGSGTLNSSGIAFFTTSALTEGAQTIVAAYLGDSNDPAANSAPLNQVVNPAHTTTTITSSLNPSTYGQPVTFTASVSFAGGVPPNGEGVEFFDGNSKIATETLNNGSAALTISKLSVGTHQIRAVYAGDGNLTPSKSPMIRQGVAQ